MFKSGVFKNKSFTATRSERSRWEGCQQTGSKRQAVSPEYGWPESLISPLTALKLQAQLLQRILRKEGSIDSERLEISVARILRQTERMVSLVDKKTSERKEERISA